jgi:uncharacterized membrane protein YebE (DUF533 family)
VSIGVLRERLRSAREDERITLAEVQSLVRAAFADGSVNEMEEMFLRAALQAHASLFDEEARVALEQFLAHNPPKAR